MKWLESCYISIGEIAKMIAKYTYFYLLAGYVYHICSDVFKLAIKLVLVFF